MRNSIELHPKGLVRHVLGLALPMAWSRFIQMFTWFIGMLMIAHLGGDVLAASALINATQIAFYVLFMSLLFAASVVSARLYGEENLDELGILFQQGFFFAIISGVLLTIVLYFASNLLLLTGQSKALIQIVGQYFHWLAWSSIPSMVLVNIQQFCYGILKQRLVILCNLLCLIFYIPCAYFLIFGAFGFDGMGVRGLALALILQLLANIGLLMFSIYYSPYFEAFRIFEWRNHRGLKYIKQLFHIGWPMSIQYGGELLAFLVITLFMGWLGEAELSASQITLQLTLLFLIPLFAVSESAGILVSQSIGSKQLHVVERTAHVCVLVGVMGVLVLSVFFFAIPDQLAALYINIHDPAHAKTLKLARWLFYISALSILGDTLRNLYTGSLRGFYDTQFPMWIGLVVLWIIVIPLGYAIGFWFHGGAIGIRSVTAVGFFIGAFILWGRWKKRVKSLSI